MIEFTLWGVHLKIWATQVLGLAIMGTFVWILWRAQNSKDNPIDLATMFVWPGTNQTSMANVLSFTAGLTATWIVVDLALRNKITGEILLAYMGTLVFGKGMTEFANAWRDRGPNPAAQNTQQIIDKAAVVSSAPAPVPPPAMPVDSPKPAPLPQAPRKRPRAAKNAKPKGKRK